MNPQVENDIFASAFGLWLGYLLALRGPERITEYFVFYIFTVFLSVIALTGLLRLAFTLKGRAIRRIGVYIIILITTFFLGPAIIYAKDREPSLSEVRDWQIFLLWAIILAWIAAAELGRFIKKSRPGEND